MKSSHKDLDKRLKQVDALAQELEKEIFQKLAGFEGNTITFTGRQVEILKEFGQIRTPAGYEPENHITGLFGEICGRLKGELGAADFLQDFKEGLRNHSDKYDATIWHNKKQQLLVEFKSFTKGYCWFSDKQVADSPADIVVIIQVSYSTDGKSVTCEILSVSEFQKLRKNGRFEKSKYPRKQALNPKHLKSDPDFKYDGISEMFSGPAMMPLPKPKKTRQYVRKKSNQRFE